MYDDYAYEYVPQLRHFQVLLARYRSQPDALHTLQTHFGLRRVAPSDPAPLLPEMALQIGEWLHAQGDPHAIAWLAGELDLGAGDGLVYYLRAHATLQDAFDEIARMSNLLFPDGRIAIEHRGNTVRLVVSPTVLVDRLGMRLRYEAIVVWLMRVLRDITGVPLAAEYVELMTNAATDNTELLELLGVEPRWGAAEFALGYSTAVCKLHLPGASEALRKAIRPMFERRLNSALQRNTTLRRVVNWLGQRSSLANVGLELAAAELSLGASTLRRQLAQSGSSFSALLAAQRARTAMDAVLNTDERTESIALRTGYGDRSALERAFRERFGITLAQCRKAAQRWVGERRDTDWSAPSAWHRHSPQLAYVRESLAQSNYEANTMCAALRADPVLHLRLLAYCMHAGQLPVGACALDAALLERVPFYVLCNLVDASLPKHELAAEVKATKAWQLANLAARASVLLAPHLLANMQADMPARLALAAMAHNLGALAAPELQGPYEDGVDFTWLLLAAWDVPPSLLQLLRARYTATDGAGRVLALSIAWAEAVVNDPASTARKALEADLATQVPAPTMAQLVALAARL
ncbi:helix-turn-helix transcriptional regulator [Rhodoferax aquaticus]|uniref:Helix-turn-helix domain-containing protein n=1 Tax=Rhodoferax aquaticus TaxID=2527691 RepID=A0A515ELP7_9BURK|nr:helix-turn-helix domain-containing protein [Rhodoferax aquaticus]QDL53590.1 helix-turn-helix domain-containing protein [Rhodoferax aquaticus]